MFAAFRNNSGYLVATRHPWPCFLFLLPLLIAYECGVVWLGEGQQQSLRNGADYFLRWALNSCGFHQMFLPPLLLAGVFLVWSIVRRQDRPQDMLGVTAGMVIESVLFALGLWLVSQELGPLLDGVGIHLQVNAAESPPPSASLEHVLGQVVTYVGAGIYEEVVFRLVTFSGLVWVLCWVNLRSPWAPMLAGVGSSLLFSAAHHIGPNGDEFHAYPFLFRSIAGLYFVFLYRLRGFGIAAGAHACYDVLVSGIFR